ncbi:hypothetical protein [Saccharibacillus alkalitolerans]|uniref:Uncharacterized protein n=1 Tax=Saccharibacillus alkalitolerans TaxID=2705290 RepID=A0ABX0F3D5_9BACL|nr:hypothetical protein [Saccharibacillus alkalitolerans]NGZ74990.1 hypothetical protein [Saccharibacillus alkalitolerans]
MEEKEEIQAILAELPEAHAWILKEILQQEKELLNRKNLQGSNIVNQIMDIVKERVKD